MPGMLMCACALGAVIGTAWRPASWVSQVGQAGRPTRTRFGLRLALQHSAARTKTSKNGRIRKIASALSRPSTADAHSRGHGMAQVALSRAQPSCPHCPPSRSPRARPFTFTSAAGRELGDRAALVCSQGTQSSIAAPKAHLGGTQCMPLSAAKAKIQCKCLHLCTFVQKKYRVLTGAFRMTAEVVNVCDGVAGSDGSYTLHL